MMFIVGGFGGFIFDRYLMPFLGSCRFFSKYDFLQGSGKNTTIIRETERVVVKDDNSVNELASSAAQSVVDVFAITDIQENAFSSKSDQKEGKRGAGTILTNDGVVVTHKNNVFEDESSKYYITIFDGNVFEANLIGVDNFSDLAFLQVEGVNLSAVPFANSDDAIIGKKVIALGRSFGSHQVSIAESILSDYNEIFNLAGKELSSSEKLEGVFNLSFNVNENYVGGPIVDYNGELIAITSFVDFDNEKEYFQIPSNKVKNSMNKIFSGEAENSAKLGVYYISIDDYFSRLSSLPIKEGAIIYSSSGKQGLAVISNSPAEKAGIKINDIIVSINGEKIDLKNPLSSIINKHKVGDRIQMEILRGNKEMDLDVQL
jgi:S1-C subfamily serine protease